MFTVDEDFHGWLLDQAAALRSRDIESLDWEHLTEEIEGMAAREWREMRDRLTTLLMHLLKLKFESDQVWRHNSWRNSIVAARRQIRNIHKDSPGVFQGKRDEVLAEVYDDARRDAAHVSGLPLSTFPNSVPGPTSRRWTRTSFPG
jgi:Domain of unknown function DUF29